MLILTLNQMVSPDIKVLVVVLTHCKSTVQFAALCSFQFTASSLSGLVPPALIGPRNSVDSNTQLTQANCMLPGQCKLIVSCNDLVASEMKYQENQRENQKILDQTKAKGDFTPNCVSNKNLHIFICDELKTEVCCLLFLCVHVHHCL